MRSVESSNIMTSSHRYCVFTCVDKTLAVEDVRQFDTYSDGMICSRAELLPVGHANNIILTSDDVQ